jgi:hypothetical protein
MRHNGSTFLAGCCEHDPTTVTRSAGFAIAPILSIRGDSSWNGTGDQFESSAANPSEFCIA